MWKFMAVYTRGSEHILNEELVLDRNCCKNEVDDADSNDQ